MITTRPRKYKRWRRELEAEELGVKGAILDKLARTGGDEAIKACSRLMGDAIARALFTGGKKIPLFIEHEQERDASLRLFEHYIYALGEPEGLPEQYLFMAYEEWQKEYNARVRWENRSLWSYLRYWLRRTRRRLRHA